MNGAFDGETSSVVAVRVWPDRLLLASATQMFWSDISTTTISPFPVDGIFMVAVKRSPSEIGSIEHETLLTPAFRAKIGRLFRALRIAGSGFVALAGKVDEKSRLTGMQISLQTPRSTRPFTFRDLPLWRGENSIGMTTWFL